MNLTTRKKRILIVTAILAGVTVAAGLMLTAFEKNLLYFYSPSQIQAGEAPVGRAFRIGGLVVEGSVQRDPNNLHVSFDLTDTAYNVTVRYDGILPDLFREGQGIVANGKLDDNGVFQAVQVLAKHDENYMPPEVADSLASVKAAEMVKHSRSMTK